MGEPPMWQGLKLLSDIICLRCISHFSTYCILFVSVVTDAVNVFQLGLINTLSVCVTLQYEGNTYYQVLHTSV